MHMLDYSHNRKITYTSKIYEITKGFAGTYPELVIFVAAHTNWPVGEGALVEPVGPPSRDKDVGRIRDVLAREHLPQHLHDLCLGLVVRLLLNTPRLLVSHGDKEDVGIRVLLLKLLKILTQNV